MFEKILFPTDFSEHAQKTLECIGEIPGVKEVMLMHVVDATHPSKRGWTHEPHIENAKLRLDEQKEHLEGIGLKAKTKVEVITQGDIARAILDEAEKEKVSLIVMGARGKSIAGELLLGGVSLNVLRLAKTNVLIMRYKLAETLEGKTFEKFCPKIFSKVLCTTDFSKPSLETLSFVKNLKGIEEVVLVHVVSKGDTEEEIEASVNEAKKKLEEIRKDFMKARLKVKAHVHVGNPPEEIISTAEEEDVSLIAMSTRGDGWFRELLLGSTAYDVARNAKRPTLIVRAK